MFNFSRCVGSGLDTKQGGEEEGGSAQRKKRRRRSKWASGKECSDSK